MLRYAIERFPEEKRRAYLNGTVRKAKAASASGQRSEAP